MLRLVFIAPFARAPKATTQARVLPLARALAARGHAVTVLVPPYDNPRESGERFRCGEAEVEALPVNEGVPEQSPRQAVEQPRLAMALVRRALELRPDVVHVFKPKAVSGLAQIALWYRRRIARARGRGGEGPGWPAIVLDTDDWEGHGGWNEYEAYPWWQKAVCDRQEHWGLTHADAVTAASRTLQAQAWSHRVAAERVVYLPNGLEPWWSDEVERRTTNDERRTAKEARPMEIRRSSFVAGEGPVILLYTRFFEFQPGRVVEVLRRVHAAVPAARLLVVGAGKYGQERTLEALARGRGLGDAVVLAGWQPMESLPGLLRSADVAIAPADDNLANRAKCSVKLLELMALGVPVVADRVGQQAEYVEPGAGGLLVEPGDPEAMAGAVVQLWRDPALARRFAAAAQRRVRELFNWDALAPRAERAYEAALSVTTRPPARLSR
ncbi:MAG: glycosyltransferase family 4 protein [Chloroflexi bacterium]|nr:glycosyltransferase family 4 protein [Chloroflexota bacterium]